MVIGRQSISLRKKSVSESKMPTVGVKNLVFAHESTIGDSTIPFMSLNEPIAWSAAGRSNPSSGDILSASLFTFKNNIKLMSSARGLILPTEYRVSNTRISFLTFTALAGEIFVVEVSDVVTNGNLVVDSRNLGFSTSLVASQTDILVGETWQVAKEPQAVLVYKNGLLLRRNTNNSSTNLDGAYYEVPVIGTNVSNTIRLNTPAVGGEEIQIITAMGFAEKPSLSILQSLESLAGQLDVMIPDLASLTGDPESKYQNAPNNIDLRTFGTTVFNIQQTLGIIIGPSGSGDYPSIQDAINAASSGDKITILPGTYTENLVVDKKIFFEGQGHNTLLDGTISLNAGSSRSMFKFLKFNDDLTGAAGVKELIITDCWIAPSKSITLDDPLENIVTVMQES